MIHRRLMLTMMVAILLMMASSAIAQDDDALQDLLEGYRDADAPAVSIYIWTPDGSYAAAVGQTELDGGRAVEVSDRFRIGSVSKTYTAVAVLLLADEGLVELDAAVTDYLPSSLTAEIDGIDGVTVSQLLTMTSGLYEYLQDDFYDAVDADPNHSWTPEEAITQFVSGEPAMFEAGTEFEYTNTNYLLLQLIVESVTDEPLHVIVREYILNPVGAESTYTQVHETLPGEFVHGYEDLDGDGELDDTTAINDGAGMGDGALVATAEDVALFYKGLFYDEELLEDDTLATMLTDPLSNDYGMGIEVIENDEYGTIYGHSGSVLGFTSDARYFVDEDIIVVLLHADTELDDAIIYEVVDAIAGE